MESVTNKEKLRCFAEEECGGGGCYCVGTGDGSDIRHGCGSGPGSGIGDGSGGGYTYSFCGSDGYRDGTGDGSGVGSRYGGGIEKINGLEVHQIDRIQTVLYSVRGNVAKGAILLEDMTLEPCYIVKGNGYFAHGKNLHKAMDALEGKMLQGMPEEERIAAFVKAHPDYFKAYPNRDLYEWHHRLTGSCEMGRDAFVSGRGLSLDGETSIEQFVELTKNAYGGSVIRKLPEAYGEILK